MKSRFLIKPSFACSNSANPNGLNSIQQSSASSHRDVAIASNPLLLAASAAAAAGNPGVGSSGSTMIGFGSGANANIVSTMQSQAAASAAAANQSNQHLLTRFMQPTLDESDLVQLDRSRSERFVEKKTCNFGVCSLLSFNS